MLKLQIKEHIISQLEIELENISKAAREAAESATDEESKAEGKYDTRGLETSYLAGAQAQMTISMQEELNALKNLSLEEEGQSSEVIGLGALITTLSDGGLREFFFSPAGGGITYTADGNEIVIITPKSPIGSQLLGKGLGMKAKLPNQNGQELTVLKIQ